MSVFASAPRLKLRFGKRKITTKEDEEERMKDENSSGG
jgi:hypothetical protein